MPARPSTAAHLTLVRDADALLEAHFAASPTGILISDEAGEIQTYNDRFLQLWGLSPDSAQAESAHDLLLYMSSQVADCQGFIATAQKLRQDPDGESYGELIHLANSRTLSCNTRPVRATNGRLLGRVWDYQDVTDVVASRSELRLARYTLDHTSTSVLWIEEDGSIASANRAAASSLGHRRKDIERMSVWDLNPERSLPEWVKLWHEIKEQGEVEFESTQVHRDGTVIPVEVKAHFFCFDTTELVCGFIRDLTEIRKAEEEQRRLEQSVQQAQKFEGLTLLAGGIAHDFNNLLVGILGNASLGLESTGDDEDLKTCLEQIRDAGEHATELTSQMLTYAGRTKLQLDLIDLSRLVLHTNRLLAAGIAKDCRLETHLAEDLPAVEVDKTQIRQVLVNLVTNASEALRGEAGTVGISTRIEHVDGGAIGATRLSSNCRPGLYVAIEVADNGVGMDAETVSRVYDPFFSTKLSAHGLGLAAVRGIVHQHNGLMEIDSKPGEGSTFTVLLPASDQSVRSEKPRVGETEWKASGTVLLVDDNPRVLDVGRKMLEITGFSVVAFESGADAVAAFERDQLKFNLAIVDLTMPEMDGSEVARALRELNPELPVLLSSGYSEIEVVGLSEAEQGMAYLPKPYTLDELRLRIQAVYRSDELDEDDWID